MRRHGPHQSATKSTSTGRSDANTSAANSLCAMNLTAERRRTLARGVAGATQQRAGAGWAGDRRRGAVRGPGRAASGAWARGWRRLCSIARLVHSVSTTPLTHVLDVFSPDKHSINAVGPNIHLYKHMHVRLLLRSHLKN
jgi:hypothetical protein